MSSRQPATLAPEPRTDLAEPPRALAAGRGRTVVSVTPLNLARDSRTLKQAMSLSAAGYRSVVVAAGHRVEVTPQFRTEEVSESILSSPSVTSRRGERLRQCRLPWIAHAAVFTGWLGLFTLRFVVRPLLALPAAGLYILHECSAYPAVALRARLERVPFIYDAHDFYSRIDPTKRQPLFDQRFITPFTRALETRAVRNAAAVMTVSNGLADALYAAYGRVPVVIRNVHDGRLDRADPPALSARLGLTGDDLLMVTVGNAKRGQALEAALSALARLPGNIHWACVGSGYERLVPLAKELGVTQRLHLIGRLPPEEIVPAIRGAHLALVLYRDVSENYQSALPNGFFQAIAAGLPQILPPLPEMSALAATHGFAVTAEPTMPDQIAAAVESLSTNTLKRTTLAAAAQRAATQLSWASEENRFLDLVEANIR